MAHFRRQAHPSRSNLHSWSFPRLPGTAVPRELRTPSKQWQEGDRRASRTGVKILGAKTIIIGNPTEPLAAGQDCLARHIDSVQTCSGPPNPFFARFNRAERNASIAEGARFINVVPWFCTAVCSSVIQHYEIYLRSDHVTEQYTLFLEGVLSKALGLKGSVGTTP